MTDTPGCNIGSKPQREGVHATVEFGAFSVVDFNHVIAGCRQHIRRSRKAGRHKDQSVEADGVGGSLLAVCRVQNAVALEASRHCQALGWQDGFGVEQ